MRRLIFLLFAILFSWISFFPQPLKDQYRFFTWGLLVIFLLLFIINRKGIRHFFSKSDIPLALMLVFFSFGIISADDKAMAIKTYIYIAGFFFLLFYIGKNILIYPGAASFISLTISFCSLIVGLIALLEFIWGKNIIYEYFIVNPFYGRYYGLALTSTQYHAPILGSYLIACFPFNFLLLKEKSAYRRILGIACLLVSIFVIFFTLSRGVLIGFLALLIFYAGWRYGRKAALLVVLISLFFMTVCSWKTENRYVPYGYSGLVHGRFDSIVSGYRARRLRIAFQMAGDYPFTGIGLNHVRSNFDNYFDKRYLKPVPKEFWILDNMYLTILAETGVFGALGFVIFIVILLKNTIQRLKQLKAADAYSQMALLIPASSLIGLLVNMAGYELFYWDNIYMIFCLLCGFLASYGQKAILLRKSC